MQCKYVVNMLKGNGNLNMETTLHGLGWPIKEIVIAQLDLFRSTPETPPSLPMVTICKILLQVLNIWI